MSKSNRDIAREILNDDRLWYDNEESCKFEPDYETLLELIIEALDTKTVNVTDEEIENKFSNTYETTSGKLVKIRDGACIDAAKWMRSKYEGK